MSKISPQIRTEVYQKYRGHCAYCGRKLRYEDMQVDHINSKWVGYLKGDNVDYLENYNPSCRACNFYKQTNDIEGFRKKLQGIIDRLQKLFIFRMAVKYGLITFNENNPIIFYFENYEGI